MLASQFEALALHHVYLEGAVLTPNMVKNGLGGPGWTQIWWQHTLCRPFFCARCHQPCQAFLSGETVLDEDNEETATISLMR